MFFGSADVILKGEQLLLKSSDGLVVDRLLVGGRWVAKFGKLAQVCGLYFVKDGLTSLRLWLIVVGLRC